MPQIFKIGSFIVYFWANEGKPREPVHVHVAERIPSENATKIWITKAGKCLICNNNSRIPLNILRDITEVIEARHKDVIGKWEDFFGEARYYC
jgi:hypothetical protein